MDLISWEINPYSQKYTSHEFGVIHTFGPSCTSQKEGLALVVEKHGIWEMSHKLEGLESSDWKV